MSMKKHITNYLTVLMGAGLARLFLFMTSVIVARTLGKSFYGQFSLFFVAFSIVPLFPQAFDTTYIRYAKNLGAGENKAEYLRINILLKIIYFLLVGCVSIPFLGTHSVGSSGELSPFFLYSLGAVGGGALCFSFTLASHFQEQGRFVASTLAESSYCLLIFLGVGVMYLFGFMNGLPQIFTVYLVVSMGSGLVFLWLLVRITGSLRLFHRHQAMTFFSLGKWVFLTSVVMYLFPRLDVTVLAKFVSYADIGIYAAANALVMLLALFSRSLNKVVLPKAMNEAIASPQEFRKFSREVLLSSGLIVLVSLVLFFLAKPAIRIVYGTEYVASASIFRVLLGGYLISMLYVPYSFIFYALGHAHLRFYLECTKIILALALLLVFIPLFGLIGAAWSITIAMGASTVCSYIILRQKIARHFTVQEGAGAACQLLLAEKEIR
ncbi:MAG: oligosaccharide flippase family protein [Desulfobulbaceae bacterium]|nr:oligosaccharide flippase family protein [Desulfobulbaceae bacterium]